VFKAMSMIFAYMNNTTRHQAITIKYTSIYKFTCQYKNNSNAVIECDFKAG